MGTTCGAGTAATVLVAGPTRHRQVALDRPGRRPGARRRRAGAGRRVRQRPGRAVPAVRDGVRESRPRSTTSSRPRVDDRRRPARPAVPGVAAAAASRSAGSVGPLRAVRRGGRAASTGSRDDQPLVLVLEDLQWATRADGAAAPAPRAARRRDACARARELPRRRGRRRPPAPRPPRRDPRRRRRSPSSSSGALHAPRGGRARRGPVPEGAPPRTGARRSRARLCNESGGSPFFVCELLHHLATTGELERLHRPRRATPSCRSPTRCARSSASGSARLPEGSPTSSDRGRHRPRPSTSTCSPSSPARPRRRSSTRSRRWSGSAMVHEVDAGRFSFAHAIVRATVARPHERHPSRARPTGASPRPSKPLQGTDHDELAHHWLPGRRRPTKAYREPRAGRAAATSRRSPTSRPPSSYQAGPRPRAPAARPATTATTARSGSASASPGGPSGIPSTSPRSRRPAGSAARLRDADVVAEAAIASVVARHLLRQGRATRRRSLVELCEDALALDRRSDDPAGCGSSSTLAAHLTYRRRPGPPRRAARRGRHELARGSGDPELIGSVLVAEYLGALGPDHVRAPRRDRGTRSPAWRGRRATSTSSSSPASSPRSAPSSGATSPTPAAASRRWPARSAASRNFYFGFLVERLAVSLDILGGRDGRAGRRRRARGALREHARRHRRDVVAADRRAGLAAGDLGTLAPVAPGDDRGSADDRRELAGALRRSRCSGTVTATGRSAVLDELRRTAARLLLAHGDAGARRRGGSTRSHRRDRACVRGPRAVSRAARHHRRPDRSARAWWARPSVSSRSPWVIMREPCRCSAMPWPAPTRSTPRTNV